MKKLNIYLILTLSFFSSVAFAQSPTLKVGVNPATINTSAILDVESTNTGFLPPRMTTAQRDAIVSPAKGLVLYNITLDCLQVNKGTPAAPVWECVGATASASATADCNTAGFVGSYVSGVALSGATYTVTVTNSSFAAIALTNNTSDLTITGVSGVTVLSVSPATLNLASAASGTITYTLQGTPAACGTLQGVWTKLSLTCTKTKTVSPNVNCATASWTAAVSPAVSSGLTNNTAYTGTYSIPYTGGGCTLAADSITQSGLTLAFAGGTIGASGNLVYTLSGTYTGTTGGSVSFTTSGGCTITVGILKSCLEIKTANALAADGVYTIDPDGTGSAFGPMQAQCDMTTDGGGWTLILNYLHQSGTSPAIVLRSTFPIINSSTLGINEGSNATSWGNITMTLANVVTFTQIRFFGITSEHSRIIHFKTPVGVSYLKSGIGSYTGVATNFTSLTGHNAFLPACANYYTLNAGNNGLLIWPFAISNLDCGGADWKIDPSGNDFSVDSNSGTNIFNSLHRVWIR